MPVGAERGTPARAVDPLRYQGIQTLTETADSVLEMATQAADDDRKGYRQEFLNLVRQA